LLWICFPTCDGVCFCCGILEAADEGIMDRVLWLALALVALSELRLLALDLGVTGPRPMVGMMTEDGGELPGVSFPLAMVERSTEIMLEKESRR
jgi:hypothetical protein